jgi:thiamine biosynthesis lipoprotein
MRGLGKTATLLSSLLVTGYAGPARAQEIGGPAVVVRESYLMGTRLRVELLAPDREAGLLAIEEIFRVVSEVEKTLSDYEPSAELARVNAADVGVKLALSAELTRMLSDAFAWSERTGGAFDPVVGSLVAAWDLRGDGRVPTAGELDRARASAGSDAVDFDSAAGTLVRYTPHVTLDAGGFGKGEALRAAAVRLKGLGFESGVMDFGGQVHVVDARPEGMEGVRHTGVGHPFERTRAVAALALRDASASTSGPSERGRILGGRSFSHHVDPRTGRLVEAWGSVTVVAQDPFVADVLSTALYVMGPEEGTAWAEGMKGVGVLFLTVDAQGAVRARMNTEMERWWVKGSFRGTLDMI